MIAWVPVVWLFQMQSVCSRFVGGAVNSAMEHHIDSHRNQMSCDGGGGVVRKGF